MLHAAFSSDLSAWQADLLIWEEYVLSESVLVAILTSGAPLAVKQHLHQQAESVGNKYVVARRIVKSYRRATQVWNPNDPVPMEVGADKVRGKGKKGKDTAKGKGKSKSGGRGKDKRQTRKCKGETSGDDSTCDSCGRRGHICNRLRVTEVQTIRSISPVHSDSSIRGVIDSSCES